MVAYPIFSSVLERVILVFDSLPLIVNRSLIRVILKFFSDNSNIWPPVALITGRFFPWLCHSFLLICVSCERGMCKFFQAEYTHVSRQALKTSRSAYLSYTLFFISQSPTFQTVWDLSLIFELWRVFSFFGGVLPVDFYLLFKPSSGFCILGSISALDSSSPGFTGPLKSIEGLSSSGANSFRSVFTVQHLVVTSYF